MANPVVWFEVMGKNGDNLRAFYSELFDWKFDVTLRRYLESIGVEIDG